MRRYVLIALVGLAYLLVATLTVTTPEPGHGQASPRVEPQSATSPAYEYDILPGLRGAATNLTLSCGWHKDCTGDSYGGAIDMLAPTGTQGKPVYAAIRTVKHRTGVSAKVREVKDDAHALTTNVGRVLGVNRTCKRVVIRIDDGKGTRDETIRYTHVYGATGVFPDKTNLDIATAQGVVTTKLLGHVAKGPWTWLNRDNAVHKPILDAAVNAGLSRSERRDLMVAGRLYTVWRLGSSYYKQIDWTEATGDVLTLARRLGPGIGANQRRYATTSEGKNIRILKRVTGGTTRYFTQPVDRDTDYADCSTTGPHLHQWGDNSSGTDLYTNCVDSAGEDCLRDGEGFPTEVERGGTRYSFCSSIWVFKIQSSGVRPPATPFTTCANLTYRVAVEQPATGGSFTVVTAPNASDGVRYTPGTRVEISPVPSAATNIFTAWGGDCGGTPATANCVLIMHGHKRVSGTYAGTGQPPPTQPPPPAPDPPGPPTGLTAEAGDGSIDLEWDDPGDTSINGYDYCTTTTSSASCTSWQPISDATDSTTMHTISGLTNGTTYYVRIRARNSADASDPSDEESATPTATPPPPTASLTITAVAGDSLPGAWVNKAEQAAGFAISGSSEAGATVTVTVGTTALSAVTAGSTGSWTVSVPAAASYVSDGRLTISATATRSGFSDGSASATVTVDTVPPSVAYNNVPTELVVDTAVIISPSTTDTDIHRYALTMGSLPLGLTFNTTSGVISGSPDAATTAAVNLTIAVTDNAGNSSDIPLSLPAVTAATTPPPTTYALAATAGAGGSVSCATASGPASCSGTFEVGTGVTVTAEAGDDYDFSHWTGDCADQGASCALTMSGPRSTQAHFAAEPPEPDTAPMFDRESVPYWTTVGRSVRQTLPGARGGNGALTYSLSGNLPPGHEFEEPRTVRGAATAVGRYVSILTVNDSDDNHAASDQDTLTVTITVRPKPEWTLTVTKSGCCGTVSQSPSGPYYQDANPPVAVTLTATPNDGYQVASWGGDCSGSATCTVGMTRNRSVSVTFEARPTWDLDVSTSGCCGNVSRNRQPPYYQGDDTEVTLTATASPDTPSGPSYSFDGWSDCDSTSGATCTVTMNGNKTVTATFSNSCDGDTGIGCRQEEEDEGDGGEQQPPP